MNKTKKILAITAIAVFALSIIAVASPVRAQTSTCYSSNWGLNVQEPAPGEVVTGSYFSIQVHSINYQVEARYAGTPDLPRIGHYHEYLDNYVPESEWSSYNALTMGKMSLTPLGNQPMPGVGAGIIDLAPTTDSAHDTINMTATSNTAMPAAGPVNGMTNTPWPGLHYDKPGLHYLTLVPACNDHTPDWAAAVNIPFIYSGSYIPEPTSNGPAGSPTISIVSPTDGTTLAGTSFYMSISTTNYLMCGGCYAKPPPMPLENNVGHWHVFAVPTTGPTAYAMPGDVSPGVFSSMMAMFMAMQPHMLTMSFGAGQQVYTIGLAPGWYTFYALLVQNNHMPLVTMFPNGDIMLNPGTFAMVNMYVSPLS